MVTVLEMYLSEKKTKERNIEHNTIKAASLSKKQNKKLSQNNEKVLKNVAAGSFAFLK